MGWCELLWVDVVGRELFMGERELFMGRCELLWVVVGGCELFMGWRELLWVDVNFL